MIENTLIENTWIEKPLIENTWSPFTWIHWLVLSSEPTVFLTIEAPGILEGYGSWTSCIEVELHCSDSIIHSIVPAILGVSSENTLIETHGLKTHWLKTHWLKTHWLKTHGLKTNWLKTHWLKTHWLKTHWLKTHWLKTHWLKTHWLKANW